MTAPPYGQAHPWHGVSPGGNLLPREVTAVIEIPKGSKAKYEVDKETGIIRLDRVLFGSVHYPANYGFVPRTYAGDNDPLDILVFSQVDLVPGCLVEAKLIGVMRMIDQQEVDDKLLAVAVHDASVNTIEGLHQLPAYLMAELQSFFEDYKKLEKKTVTVENFLDVADAERILEESLAEYSKRFSQSSQF